MLNIPAYIPFRSHTTHLIHFSRRSVVFLVQVVGIGPYYHIFIRPNLTYQSEHMHVGPNLSLTQTLGVFSPTHVHLSPAPGSVGMVC